MMIYLFVFVFKFYEFQLQYPTTRQKQDSTKFFLLGIKKKITESHKNFLLAIEVLMAFHG